MYDLLRAGHILAVIAWMAGLLYLPRLFAYDVAQAEKAEPLKSEMQGLLRAWQGRLLRFIMNPAMIVAWVFGLSLIWYDGAHRLGWDFLAKPWMIAKLLGVVFLTGWHHFLSTSRKRIAAGQDRHSEKFWRMTNELPFLAAIVMVIAVTTEFGS